MDVTVNIVNASDHYPFGKRMRFSIADAEGNRYQHTGHEFDEETGFDYHGARYYNRELGRYMNVDRFAEKFFSQSSYVYAGNMPVVAVDVNGDSVLFYSQSGTYLGFAHDNKRYKGKNLLVIINDQTVDNFVTQYKRKRSAEYTKDLTPTEVEAHVAGLEGMGTTYDVTSMKTFFNKYHDQKTDESGKLYTEKDDTKQVEWGAKFKTAKNPYYDKNNWRVLNDKTPFNSGLENMVIWDEKNPDGEIHIHTEWLKSSPSKNDWDRQRTINEMYPNSWSVVIDGRGMFFFNASSKDGQYNPTTIYVEKNSYKDASIPKFE